MQNPNHEQIESRAYELWQERGCPVGSPDDDWFTAEREFGEPEEQLTKLAREVGSLVGSAMTFLTEMSSGKSQ